MDNEITITYSGLVVLLDDFREWYEFTWCSDRVEIDDRGMSAPEYWVWWKRSDPCWPNILQNG